MLAKPFPIAGPGPATLRSSPPYRFAARPVTDEMLIIRAVVYGEKSSVFAVPSPSRKVAGRLFGPTGTALMTDLAGEPTVPVIS